MLGLGSEVPIPSVRRPCGVAEHQHQGQHHCQHHRQHHHQHHNQHHRQHHNQHHRQHQGQSLAPAGSAGCQPLSCRHELSALATGLASGWHASFMQPVDYHHYNCNNVALADLVDFNRRS